MAYCSITDIKTLTDLSAEEVGDGDLNTIIEYATAELNSEIAIDYENELVKYISDEKENEVDGSNTTFYVKYPYLCDRNDDGTIDTSDLYVYTLDSEGTRTEQTVSSVDWELGQFVLSSAPGTDETLYVSYRSVKVDCNTPHPLVKKACIDLAAAIAYSKVEASNFKRIGGLSGLSLVAPETYNIYYQLYRQTLARIRKVLMIEKKSYEELPEDRDFMNA